MKSFSKFMLPAALVVVLLSCSKDSDDKVAAVGGLSAKIDGVDWSATGAASINYDINDVRVGGYDANYKSVHIVVFKSKTKGTYNTKGQDGAMLPDAALSLEVSVELPYSTANYNAGQTVGSITISEVDEVSKTISGTFSGKVKRFMPVEKEVEIKAGTFNKVPYTVFGSFNSFSAKVAGVQFIPTVINGEKALGKITLNFSFPETMESITITVPDNIATGTVLFGQVVNPYHAIYNNNSAVYGSISGTLKITTHNTTSKRIEGTFNFSAKSLSIDGTTLEVTEGAFSVMYN